MIIFYYLDIFMSYNIHIVKVLKHLKLFQKA